MLQDVDKGSLFVHLHTNSFKSQKKEKCTVELFINIKLLYLRSIKLYVVALFVAK